MIRVNKINIQKEKDCFELEWSVKAPQKNEIIQPLKVEYIQPSMNIVFLKIIKLSKKVRAKGTLRKQKKNPESS